MQNHSTVLDQITWGIHLNFEGCLASPPNPLSWLTQLQQQDWQRRGIIVWDADLRIVAHLYAGYALELLEYMKANENWKLNGFLVSSSTYQLSSNESETLSNGTAEGVLKLENQIKLAPDRARDFFDFLNTHERLLKYISSRDREGAEDGLRTVFRLIAAYGRKVRERKGGVSGSKTRSPKSSPSIFRAAIYFTVYQATQVCCATSKQIRSWIRRGKLDAIELPGLGIIIASVNGM